MPGERWGWSPRAEFAVQVVVEDFECVPRHAPGSRPSLDPLLEQRAAFHGVGNGTRVWGEELVVGAWGRNRPHARFPQFVRAVPYGRDQQVQGLFEVATEALNPDGWHSFTVARG